MRQLKMTLIFLLNLVVFSLYSTEINEFSQIENVEMLRETTNAQCKGGCVNVISDLKKRFSELILFQTLIIPTLNDRRLPLSGIERIGQRFNQRFISAIRNYNPSLNVKHLKKIVNQMTRLTARDLIDGRLRQQDARRNIKRKFELISQFWKKFIFSDFDIQRARTNFNRVLELTLQLNIQQFNRVNNRFQNNGNADYQELVASVLNIIDSIEES